MTSAEGRPLPPKKEVFLMLLEGPSVFIHLDPRKSEVSVPPWFKRDPRLILQVGRQMAVPIPDLEVDDAGVSCTLSFSRSPFKCVVPWSSVYALVGEDNRGMVWPSDVPPEVAAQMRLAAAKPAPAPPPAPAPEVAAAPAPAADATDGPSTPKKRKKKEKAAKPEKVAKQAAEAKAEAKAAPLPAPSVEPAPARAVPAAAGKKPKRELPSYLRVIK